MYSYGPPPLDRPSKGYVLVVTVVLVTGMFG
jgi:hypothetical protein